MASQDVQPRRRRSLPPSADDVRDLYSTFDPVTLGIYLQRQWPTGGLDYKAEFSGINCLTMVIRVIYYYAGACGWDRDRTRDYEAANPFMAHAWKAFSVTNDESQLAELPSLFDKVWKMPIHELFDDDRGNEASFEWLINSDLTAETMLSWPEFKLYRLHWKIEKDTAWTKFDPATAPACITRWLQDMDPNPRPAQMKVVLHATTNLSDDLEAKFGRLTVDDSISAMVRPFPALFLYMTCTIGDVDEGGARVTLDQISNIKARGPHSPPENRDIRYTLIAMVKYRDPVERGDSIQLFDLSGAAIAPDTSKGRLQDYLGDWRLEQCPAGTRLFLLYTINTYREDGATEDEAPTDRRERSTEMASYSRFFGRFQ